MEEPFNQPGVDAVGPLWLTLREGDWPEIVCLHDVSLHWHAGVQYVAPETDSGIVDEDVHVTVALEDLRRSSVHSVTVSQVKGHGAGSMSLLLEQEKKVLFLRFFVNLVEVGVWTCSCPEFYF